MATSELNATKIIEAIKKRRGFISMAARDLGVSRQTVYNHIKQHPTILQAINEERELLKDVAEVKLLEKINAGDITALIFFLKTQGRDRGYVERLESANLNIDVTALTDEQLRRIADGESPVTVITTQSGG